MIYVVKQTSRFMVLNCRLGMITSYPDTENLFFLLTLLYEEKVLLFLLSDIELIIRNSSLVVLSVVKVRLSLH